VPCTSRAPCASHAPCACTRARMRARERGS
jgi:hypothetical protein